MGEMHVWVSLAVMAAAGSVGGVVNALLSDNGFIMPLREKTDGRNILRPGFLTNVVIGAIAAAVSWGLYGPFASEKLAEKASPTLSALVGALLVGIAGARWLTNEVDKTLLRSAASSAAAAAKPSQDAARKMMTSTPSEVLAIANQLEETMTKHT